MILTIPRNGPNHPFLLHNAPRFPLWIQHNSKFPLQKPCPDSHRRLLSCSDFSQALELVEARRLSGVWTARILTSLPPLPKATGFPLHSTRRCKFGMTRACVGNIATASFAVKRIRSHHPLAMPPLLFANVQSNVFPSGSRPIHHTFSSHPMQFSPVTGRSTHRRSCLRNVCSLPSNKVPRIGQALKNTNILAATCTVH